MARQRGVAAIHIGVSVQFAPFAGAGSVANMKGRWLAQLVVPRPGLPSTRSLGWQLSKAAFAPERIGCKLHGVFKPNAAVAERPLRSPKSFAGWRIVQVHGVRICKPEHHVAKGIVAAGTLPNVINKPLGRHLLPIDAVSIKPLALLGVQGIIMLSQVTRLAP